jgi:hypothetical protein
MTRHSDLVGILLARLGFDLIAHFDPFRSLLASLLILVVSDMSYRQEYCEETRKLDL